MEEPAETIVEEKEELMVPITGNSTPTLRTAHFLRPIVDSTKRPVPEHPSLGLSPLPLTFEPKNWPLKVKYNGWRNPSKHWKSWVYHLKPSCEYLWRQSGIFEAIMTSTFTFRRDEDLMIGMAEKWCPSTNTFIFPWGEATLTLEDIIILGGYSSVGSPVCSCLVESREQRETENKLKQARTEVGRGPSRKASQGGWMRKFICSGSEIEHEAFLSLWLEWFVFHDSHAILKPQVFPIAIHLAEGRRIALAPAVLASIYRDLSVLKATIVLATKLEIDENGDNGALALTLWSPLQLVQLWAWERFPAFQSEPNLIRNGDMRSALWDQVKGVKVENVRLALDSAENTFRWRPYSIVLNNWQFPVFYRDKEGWLDTESNEDILSFALCLRVSELVGLDCVQQYLPHRVAMQFGLDQDIPCSIAPSNEIPEVACCSYIRPFTERKLYVPSRFFESDVTIKYLKWWKKSISDSHDLLKDVIHGVVRRKRNPRKRVKTVPLALIEMKADNNADVPPGFPPKCTKVKIEDYAEGVKPTAEEPLSAYNKGKNLFNIPSSDFKYHAGHADVPPGFPHKCIKVKIEDYIEDVKPTTEELLKAYNKGKSLLDVPPSDFKHYAVHATPGEKGSPVKPIQSVMHVNELLGRSVRAFENTGDSKAGWFPVSSTESINKSERESSYIEIPMLLEARLARLESSIAELKAAKFAGNLISEGCSGQHAP